MAADIRTMNNISTEIDNMDEIKFLDPFLKGQNNLRILDIGCGEGSLLSNIYNKIPKQVSKLIGVDNADEETISFHNDDFADNHNSIIGNKPMKTGVASFYRQDGFDFLNLTLTPQDLIIFSNILHFSPWDKTKNIIQSALTKLSFSGVVYIKVANELRVFNTKDERYPFDESKLEELKFFSKILAFEKTHIHYNLILKP